MHMKFYLLFIMIFSLGLINSSFGQISFEYDLSTPLDDHIGCGFCDSNNDVVFPGWSYKENSGSNANFLLKFYPDGTEKMVYIDGNDSLLCFCVGVELYQEGYFFVGAKISEAFPDSTMRLVVLKTDYDLNVIGIKDFSLPDTYTQLDTRFAITLDNNGSIVVALGLGRKEQGIYRYDYGFYRFTTGLDLLSYKILDTFSRAIPYCIKRMNNSSNLMVIGTGYLSWAEGELLFIDEDFNFIRANRIHTLGDFFYSEGWLSDTTFLIAERKTIDNGTYDEGQFRIGRMDTSAVYYESFVVDHPDTIDYVMDHFGMSYLNDTTVYLCGFNVDNGFGFDKPKIIFLYLLDRDLNLKRRLELGNDHFYWGRGVIATKDGGCMIWAQKLQIPYNGWLNDHHFWKVMPDDLNIVTRVTDVPNPDFNSVVWPNPAADIVNIDISAMENGSNLRLAIYDASGRKCFDATEVVSGRFLEVNLRSLPAGVYLYVVTSKNEVDRISGKFIKN